jgi:hypothetical protein
MLWPVENPMTTLSAPAPATDLSEAVLQVFQTSAHPLTVSQALKLYQGPKLSAKELARMIEDELVMQGRLFKCSPSGKSTRYWRNDEEQRVRETVERLLGEQPLPESKLASAVNKALPKVSSVPTIKGVIKKMRQDGQVHERPGKGKTSLLGLQPFDAAELIAFKKGTLTDLASVLAKVEPLGVSLQRFLHVLAEKLRPSGQTASCPALASAPSLVQASREENNAFPTMELEDLIIKGMRDLDPAVQSGASVLLRDLRRHMPPEYRQHETFDAAVIRLAEDGRVVLHRHDQPSYLTDAERDELVRDQSGTYFTSIAHRV